MIVSINQPAYLPWPGYFHRIAASDLHIILDHVQFEKNSLTNRNRIKSATGPLWLTVPVKTSGLFGHLPINRLTIDNKQNWPKKHWETIRQSYARAPHFGQYADFWKNIYARPWENLFDLCNATNSFFLNEFQIRTRQIASSTLNPSGAKSELVLNLCRQVGATVYLSGPMGRNYLDEKAFLAAGIQVLYHDYQYPTYPQLGTTFEANLSALDMLMNCGGGAARHFDNAAATLAA